MGASRPPWVMFFLFLDNIISAGGWETTRTVALIWVVEGAGCLWVWLVDFDLGVATGKFVQAAAWMAIVGKHHRFPTLSHLDSPPSAVRPCRLTHPARYCWGYLNRPPHVYVYIYVPAPYFEWTNIDLPANLKL